MLTYIIVGVSISCCLAYASLLEPIKPKNPKWLGNMLRCPLCWGFKIGIILSLIETYGVMHEWYLDCWVIAFFSFIVDVWYDSKYSKDIKNADEVESVISEK